MTALSNGNYVVSSPAWDNGAVTDAGAVTWGSGTGGISGVVSAANSLVGSSAIDDVGGSGADRAEQRQLRGRQPCLGQRRSDGCGCGDVGQRHAGGISGAVSAANSLVGSSTSDRVGQSNEGNYHVGYSVTALSNGNYVVRSPYWDNGAATDAGAVTFGSGTSGISGVVSAANSLVGSTANDRVGYGSGSLTPLSNGNYVVTSPYWDNGAATDAGAVTWGSGTSGVSGAVSEANSLVGSTTGDQIGYVFLSLDSEIWFVTALSNGNYVVTSPYWDNGAATNAGAATFGSGNSGVSGVVSATNSLVGSTAYDFVGAYDATALSNGNYVVASPHWDNGVVSNAGAVTFGSGTSGVSGAVSEANSLVGSTMLDQVGYGGVATLSNGNYVVRSPNWDNGAAMDAGAMTFGSGVSGVSGTITSDNSAIGGASNTSLQQFYRTDVDDVNDTFFVGFLAEGGGRVRVGSQLDGFAPDVNNAPTGLLLSSSVVGENEPAGTSVSTLFTIDPDADDTFTYALVSGDGDTDNPLFVIPEGSNGLQTAASFDFEAKSSYSIFVRSTDAGGLSIEKQFTISVSNVNETPRADAGCTYLGKEGGAINFDASASGDPDGDALLYRWDFDGDGRWDTLWSDRPTATHAWLDDWTGTVGVEVTDPAGLSSIDIVSVSIINVAPTVMIANAPSSSWMGMPVELTSSVTDPGALDTLSYEWNATWDGNPYASGTGTAWDFTPEHRGIYQVTLTVADDDGGVGTDTTTILVYGTAVWDGGGADEDWTTAANWSSDLPPITGEDLVFPSGAARLWNVNDYPAGTEFKSILFTGYGYQLHGNAVTLTHGLRAAGSDEFAHASVHLTQIALAADQVFSASDRGYMLINCPVDVGDHNLDLAIDRSAGLNGAISGNGGLHKTGLGWVELKGENSYTGLTAIDQGQLILSNSMGLGDISMGTTVADGAALKLDNGVQVASEHLQLSGSGIAQRGALDCSNGSSWGGSITLNGDTMISATGSFSISGAIDGAHSLTIWAYANDMILTGPVGSSVPVAAFLVPQASTATLPEITAGSGGIDVRAWTLHLEGDLSAADGNITVRTQSPITVDVDVNAGAGNITLDTHDLIAIGENGSVRSSGGVISLDADNVEINETSAVLDAARESWRSHQIHFTAAGPSISGPILSIHWVSPTLNSIGSRPACCGLARRWRATSTSVRRSARPI